MKSSWRAHVECVCALESVVIHSNRCELEPSSPSDRSETSQGVENEAPEALFRTGFEQNARVILTDLRCGCSCELRVASINTFIGRTATWASDDGGVLRP